MKKILLLIAAFFAIAAHAQRIVTPYTTITLDPSKSYTVYQSGDTTRYCYIDTLQAAYYKDSIHNYTITIPKTCTDTTGWKIVTSNCRKEKVSSKLYSRVRVCDTTKTPITQSRDCSYTLPKSDTLHNYFYFPAITKEVCETSIGSSKQFGVSLLGRGNIANDIRDMKIYNPGIYTVYLQWKFFEPTKGNYDFNYIDNIFKTINDSGLLISYIMLVAPYDDNTPTWLNIVDGVPIVTTHGPNAHTGDRYPYFFNANYQTAYYKMLKALAMHIKTINEPLRSKIVSGLNGMGSTGDPGGYKGDPDNTAYAYTNADWDAFTFRTWDSLLHYYSGLETFRLRFNPGNDAENTNHLDDSSWYKNGEPTHTFSFTGEVSVMERWKAFSNYPTNNKRLVAEIQNVWDPVYWQYAPVKNSQYLIFSALNAGMDIVLLPGGWKTQNTADTRPTDFFNKYAGNRKASIYNKGFIALGGKVDYADTVWFPANKYGPLINPDLTIKGLYDRAIRNISRYTTSDENKEFQTWVAVEKYINSARQVAVRAANPQATYPADTNDFYHNDYIIGGVKNYGRFITMIDPVGTSTAVYRVGPDTAIFGRFCRQFLIKNGVGEMKFQLDTLLKNSIRNATINITVTYYDEGTGSWSLNFYNSAKQAGTHPGIITNTRFKEI
jgi:hypothetical protein